MERNNKVRTFEYKRELSDLGTKGNEEVKEKQHGGESVVLKQDLGLISGVSIIVGVMIGSGIFISPTGVLSGTGSVGLSLVVWAGCGILALFGALSLAELGTAIPKSGAEYSYVLEAFGSIPAYMISWTKVMITRPMSNAIVCLSFAEYVASPIFDDCGPPASVKKLLAAATLITIAVINCYSAKLAARVQVIFTVAKLLALLTIIVGGLVMIANGHTTILAGGFEGTTSSPSAIALAFYKGLWAYDGWNGLNTVTEELKNSKVNLPRALWISLPLVTIIYLLTNISYFSVMTTDDILTSPAVAVTWGHRVLGVASIIIPVSVAMSTFGAANGSAFTTARIMYVSAREGHLPEVLSFVNVKQVTPMSSLILNTIISLFMVIPGNIFSLIDFFSFTVWMMYGAVMLALIVMRFTRKDMVRPYKVPIVLPIVVLAASIYLVVAPIIQEPKIEFLYATLFVVSGLIFYIPLIHYKLQFRIVDKLTMYLQLLLEVAPSKYQD